MIQRQDFFENKQFLLAVIAVGIVIVAYAAINGFVIGGTDFVLTVTSYASPLFSALAAALAVRTWYEINARDVAKKVWAEIALGLMLWAIGESTSAGATLIYGGAVPKVPISDIFRLTAYLILVLALIRRLRSLGVKAWRHHAPASLGLSVFMLIVTGYFFIWPALQKSTLEDVAASLVGILYPSGDLLVMLLSFLILIRLGNGSLSAVWQVLSLGLALRSFGDLMYNYATSRGLYWPYQNHITLVSIMSDIPYVTSYLVISMGVYMQHVLFNQAAVKPAAQLGATGLSRKNGPVEVLISINAIGKVSFVSDNFADLVREPDKTQFIGAALQNVLGLDAQTEITLIYEISRWGYIRNRALRILDQKGQLVQVMLTAAASGSDGNFSGADLVLRASLDAAVPDEAVAAQAGEIYVRAGVRQIESLYALKVYCAARAKMLHTLVARLGGENVAESLVQLFNQAAQRGNWEIKMAGPQLLFPEGELDDHLAQGLPILMKTITHFAKNVVGYQIVEEEINSLEAHIEPGQLQTLANYGLR